VKPLIILVVAFVIFIFTVNVAKHGYDIALSARMAIAVMLVFTSIGHFAFTRGMAMMMPGFIPYKTKVVYFTGLFEILAGPALMIETSRTYTAWLLILFFLLIVPANINAALKHVDYQKGDYSGSGVKYLWFRVPLQLLFIAWIYVSSIMF
jgi:uncharacterized membrane protein